MYVEDVGGYDAQQNGENRAEAHTITGEYGDLYQREVHSFCDSLLNDKPFVVDARDALLVQRVIEAAYRSNDERKIIDL